MSTLLAIPLLFTLSLCAPPEEGGFALVLKTANDGLARGALSGFGSGTAVEPPEPGQHHVILVDEEGQAFLRPGQGDIGWLRLEARPPLLMKILARQVAEARAVARAALPPLMSTGGLDRSVAQEFVDALFRFPAQVDHLRVDVDGSPRTGFAVDLELSPAGGSGFADFMSALAPNPEGAPVVGGESTSFWMRVSLEPGALAAAFGPLSGLMASIYAGAGQEETDEFMRRWLDHVDGTFATAMGPDGTSMVMGLRDAESARAFVASEQYRQFTELALEQSPIMEGRMVMDAFLHRGVSAHLQEAEAFDEAVAMNPLFSGENLNSYIAVAGDLLVSSMMGSTEEKMKRLIDRALDGEIARAPLPDDAVLELVMDFGALIASAGQSRPQDAPRELWISASAPGGRLRVRVTTR
jgi:hypothetical protein